MNRLRNATIKDVARAAGVSYSTVSRVVNNHPHVRPDKRARVLEAMARLGYVANLQARSLVGGRTGVIGLLIQEFGNEYNGQVVFGIDEALYAAQYQLMLHTTHRHASQEPQVVQALTRGLTDGLLLLVPLEPGKYLTELHQRRFPYVVIDHQGFDEYSPTVGAANWDGAYSAMRYLIELGHRRIGFLAGVPVLSGAKDRFAAYRAALADYGLPFDEALVAPGEFSQPVSYRSAARLLDLPEPPTAIFAANDLSAMGVYDAVRDRGLSIPQDISVIGFDDIPQAARLHPPLTTVRQPLVEMGRTAVRILLDIINAPDRPLERVVLDTALIIRESCQPPRQPAAAGRVQLRRPAE